MKILIIYPHGNALNPTDGGATRVWNLVKSLIDKNFNVTILHSSNSQNFESKALKEKCKVYYYKELKILGAPDWYLTDLNPFFIKKLFHILRKQNFEIIHLEYLWGFLTTKFLSKKSSVLIYDSMGVESEFIQIVMNHPNFPMIFKPFAKIFAKIYEKLVCKLADVITGVSNFDLGYYIKNYKISKNKTFLIQIPSTINQKKKINRERLRIESREKLGLPLDKTIIIFHGSLPHPANQEAFDIIESYISPNITNPDIIFVLAGLNLKLFKKRNMISLGFVDDLNDLLYSADFAIVPIMSGSGMRVKCVDYISIALPFITTKKGIQGIDFLESNEDHLMYNTVNSEFLKGINLLHDNKELRSRLHINLQKKSDYLTKNKFKKRITRLYQKLMNQK